MYTYHSFTNCFIRNAMYFPFTSCIASMYYTQINYLNQINAAASPHVQDTLLNSISPPFPPFTLTPSYNQDISLKLHPLILPHLSLRPFRPPPPSITRIIRTRLRRIPIIRPRTTNASRCSRRRSHRARRYRRGRGRWHIRRKIWV